MAKYKTNIWPRKLFCFLIGVSALEACFFVSVTLAVDGDFFESRIRPVLVERCYGCHNSTETREGGLSLDHQTVLLEGGSRGPAIRPGDAKGSLLIQALKHERDDLRMPEDGPKLSAQVVADFERWINEGVFDPRRTAPSAEELATVTSWEAIRERRKQWWSFQPIRDVSPPLSDSPLQHPVDRFVLDALEKTQIEPVRQADARTLIRRTTYALTGLPPTPEQLDDWLPQLEGRESEIDQRHWEGFVDQLLESPHFGERWARYWMDWFRYADSHGSEGDPDIPYAWRYRDYLIRALNQDVPHDQLVLEHLAGDLLPYPRVNQVTGLNESIFGIGHYRFVQHGYSPTDALEEQVRFTENQIDVVSKAFLGLTVSCARCHDHKFDAISQQDFYAWYGIMVSCRPGIVTSDTQDRKNKNKVVLKNIKRQIKSKLAKHWLATADAFREKLISGDLFANELGKELVKAAESQLHHPLHLWVKLRAARTDETHKQMWIKWQNQWKESTRSLHQRQNTNFPLHLDLRNDYANWHREGNGLPNQVSSPGEFHIRAQGDQIVSNIYPSGVFSHTLSDKHNGVLTSAAFDVTMDQLWVRVAGTNGARVRYCIQHYPRPSGPVYKSHTIKNSDFQWMQWDLRYWQGDRAYVEIATAADLPIEARLDNTRSMMGIAEVIGLRDGQPVPKHEMVECFPPEFTDLVELDNPPQPIELASLYTTALTHSLESWRDGSISDRQANFLGYLVRNSILPNSLDAFPECASLVKQYRHLEDEVPVLTRTPGVWEGDVTDQPLMVRGNHRKQGDPVRRRFLEAIDDTPYETNDSGRLELAQSIVATDNPLTNRVIVNRVWHYLFGKGIVRTTDNFGRLGEQPSHPDLLDFLATYFQDQGHSLKKLIRFLVTSRTFQLSSQPSDRAKEVDSDNRYYSYFLAKRLDAEAIRDSMLDCSGQLIPELYGPPVAGKQARRSIYVRHKRNTLDPFLTAFDAPFPSSTKGRRDITNVPAQSLALMNDPFVIEKARQLGDRVTMSSTNNKSRIQHLFQLTLGRLPNDDELKSCQLFISQAIRRTTETRQQLVNWRNQKKQYTNRIARIIDRTRSLLDKRDSGQFSTPQRPVAFAAWEFDGNLRDSIGQLHGIATGNAQTSEGMLVLNGDAYVVTKPLPKTLTEKTFEVSLELSTLDQTGGGAITVQTTDGTVFDSVVFAEREPAQWTAGSNVFARTKNVGGPAEVDNVRVCVTIVYTSDGMITLYRNGQPYGKPYKRPGPVRFESGKSQVLIGMRHGTESSRTDRLRARIDWARLYDRALTAQEVLISSQGEPDFVPLSAILAEMTDVQKSEKNRLEMEVGQLDNRITSLLGDTGQEPLENSEWHELALAVFNFKEFIFVQ